MSGCEPLSRLGTPPKDRVGEGRSLDAYTCPDLFEFDGDQVAVVGTDADRGAFKFPDGTCPGGRMVIIPRSVFLAAMEQLEDE